MPTVHRGRKSLLLLRLTRMPPAMSQAWARRQVPIARAGGRAQPGRAEAPDADQKRCSEARRQGGAAAGRCSIVVDKARKAGGRRGLRGLRRRGPHVQVLKKASTTAASGACSSTRRPRRPKAGRAWRASSAARRHPQKGTATSIVSVSSVPPRQVGRQCDKPFCHIILFHQDARTTDDYSRDETLWLQTHCHGQ